MRLTLVISDLGAGGAERVMTILANHWASRGHAVHIVCQYGEPGQPPFFPLSDDIAVERIDFDHLACSSPWKTAKLRQLSRMRRAIAASSPELILSFMDTVNVRTSLAALGMSVPIVVAEHCDPHVRPLGPTWEVLRQWTYRRAAGVVALSHDALGFFAPTIQVRGRVIPNPVLPPTSSFARSQPSSRADGTIVSMGRLHDVKGFDLLIAAFARIAHRHPGWKLDIWGSGPQRETLEREIHRLGLQTVRLRGATQEPYEKLAAADMFVMSSRTEGFPMALGEAMAIGLPCVSFDCPSGPRQLIRHDRDGWLVPDGDVIALATAMEKLIEQPSERIRLGTAAREVTTRFSLERIGELWEQLFSAAVSAASATSQIH